MVVAVRRVEVGLVSQSGLRGGILCARESFIIGECVGSFCVYYF